MSDLPREVITDILSRLPVKTLLRFRSTSKSWKSLIDSQHFISVHLSRSLSSNTKLILRHESDLHETNFPTLDPPPVSLNHPLMCYSNSITLLGSCNGILCISNVADDIAFWNPSLRKHRMLPYLPLPRRPDTDTDTTLLAARVFGFGFDSLAPDYKLLRISYFVNLHRRTFDSQVKLFTLKANAWKTLPSMPYALCCARTMGVLVGNALHWIVTRKLEPDQPDLIIAFDLNLEIFHEVPLPDTDTPLLLGGGFEIDVALLGGCLCMTVNFQNARIDVWVMRSYGRRDSWCKVFTLGESREMRSLKCVKPLGYSRDGTKVLLEHDRKKLFWYHLGNKQVAHVRIPRLTNLSEAMICLGTLVPPSLPRQNCRKLHTMGLGCERPRKARDDFLSQGFKLTL